MALIASGSAAGTTTGVDTTGANLIIVGISSEDPPGFTDSKSNTWTPLTKYTYSAPDGQVQLFYCFNPTVGSGHTFTPTASYQAIGFLAFDNATATPFDQQNGSGSNTGTTTAPGSITPTQNNELVIAVAGLGGDANTVTVDSGMTVQTQVAGISGTQYGIALAWAQQGTAAAISPTLTYSGGSTTVGSAIASFKASAAGTTVAPGVGSLTFAGQAPAAISPITVTPGAGTLRLVGQEPQLPKHITTLGDTGVLSYVAGESMVGGLEPPQVTTTQPSDGTLTLAGTVSTVTVSGGSGTTVAPTAGALVLAGQTPTTLQNVIRAPDAGALVLAGQAPVLLQNMIAQPSAGALVLAGQAPVVLQDSIRAPSAGALVLAGQAPTVLQSIFAQPGAGTLVLAGQAPVLLQNLIAQSGTGALTLAGQSPAVLNGDAKVAQPAEGVLVLAGQAPTVLAAITAAPGAGVLTLAGQAPTVTATQTAQPSAGALVLAGQTPTLSVTANVVANPLTGALVFTGLTPTVGVSGNHTASPSTGALALVGEAPTIPIPSPTVTPDPGALFLEGLAPGIVVSGDTLLSAKYIARRPNVRVKGLQPEPQPAAAPLAPEITNMPGAEEVVRRAQGLNLGLITAPPAAPVPPAAVPVVEVPSIGVTVPAGPPPAAPEPAPAAPAPEPAAPPTPATQDDVAALHKAILEATKVEMGAQADRVLLVLASVLEKVDDLQTKIEADAKARDLRERNMLRAKQIAERMLRDLEK